MACVRGMTAVIVAVAIGSAALGETICVPDDYATIQAAIDAAVDEDEICVAPGRYTEAIDFIGNAVRLYSMHRPDLTVIHGPGWAAPVVRCVGGEGRDTILEGFTIQGGRALQGGGMLIHASSPTVIDCTYVGNSAREGGGLAVIDGSVNLRACLFDGNSADPDHLSIGGALLASGSEVVATGCKFTGNSAMAYPWSWTGAEQVSDEVP